MEGLRGVAVFLVFLVHYAMLSTPKLHAWPAMLQVMNAMQAIGGTGVDLFFVLSGYLIYGTLLVRQQTFSYFMARRIQRLYPAFAVVFTIYVALSFGMPAENKLPAGVAASTLYLVANFLMLPGLFPITPMITVAWSLSYEMFFYLCLPPVILVFGLRNRSTAWRMRAYVITAACLILFCAIWGGPVRLIMFISGMLLFDWLASGHSRVLGDRSTLVVVFAAMLTALVPGEDGLTQALHAAALFAPFGLLCLACFTRTQGLLARMMVWTPLRWLGNMSYSYYLLHGLTLKACFLLLGRLLPPAAWGPTAFVVLLPLTFLLTLMSSAILFLAVERPNSLLPRPARQRPFLV